MKALFLPLIVATAVVSHAEGTNDEIRVVVEATRLSVDMAGTNYQPVAQQATSRIVMKASETPTSTPSFPIVGTAPQSRHAGCWRMSWFSSG